MQPPHRRACRRPSFEPLESRALLADDVLLVGFAGGVPSRSAQLLLDRLGAMVEQTFPEGPSIVRLPVDRDPQLAARRLARALGVRYAQPDAALQVHNTLPDDPRFPAQWGLSNPAGIDIQAAAAWEITTGSPNVIVAIIDGGIDLSHPDLVGQLWVNPREIAGNGRDDDRNGKIDDIHGWNFITNTNHIADDDGHGTHIAGIIAAAANNGEGVAGIAPGVKLMPLKFLDRTGNGDTSHAVAAIYYAVDQGAKVINASWGGAGNEAPLRDAIQYAANRGVVFVTAAGNQGRNNDVTPNYPPNFRLVNMLVVAAVDASGNLAGFSNYGRKTVDLAAPGVGILSTVTGGRYASYSGTSMAAPFVAGVAALLASKEPKLSAAQIVQRVLATVSPLPSLAAKTVSGGIVNAHAALTASNPANNQGNGTPSPAPTQTQTADDLHAALLGSNAYYARSGGTPRGFITALFRDLYSRAPDEASLRKWTLQLQRGTSRTAVAKAILTSDEARRTLISRWYISDLGRPPSSLATLKASSTIARDARRIAAGTGPNTIRAGLLASTDYFNRNGGSISGFLTALFRTLYAREASSDELATWTAALRAGTSRLEVVQALIDTVEARATTIALWHRTELGVATPLADLKHSAAILDQASRTAFS